MPQSSENSKHKATAKFLAQRLAILMVICRVRYGVGWSVWMGEGLYTGETGDEFRQMPEFKVAMEIIRGMVRREIARPAAGDHKSANP
ncbi:MAG: hypothetical protein IIC63_06790 [Proteobacteria bacterium]|nr:hypothetical protein [Pseudomonadota bacterium]